MVYLRLLSDARYFSTFRLVESQIVPLRYASNLPRFIARRKAEVVLLYSVARYDTVSILSNSVILLSFISPLPRLTW